MKLKKLKKCMVFIAFIALNADIFYGQIISGAERMEEYLPIINRGKVKVAVVCNHTSMVGKTHLVDTLLSKGIYIKRIFVPEHGFRGDVDAGVKVSNSVDTKTGIPIISLYGENKRPQSNHIEDLDYIIFDIQDVGVRFYTYISTLQYIMEAVASAQKYLIVLDRPNPNGHYIDGPILEERFKSFVGLQPIPVVYGLTIGEYANMLVNEGWLEKGLKPKMKVVPCLGYNHNIKFEMKIPPSPNLKSDLAVGLYPSLCFFEGTNVSVGRGTDRPFEMFGSPYLDPTIFIDTFTPVSKKGALSPPFKNQKCYGIDLKGYEPIDAIDLDFLLAVAENWTNKNVSFFKNEKSSFFDKLAGTDKLRKMILSKKTAAEIKKSWRYDLAVFYKLRKKSLLYEDFPNPFE